MGSTLIGDDYLISAVSFGLVTRSIGPMIQIIKGFPGLSLSKAE